MSDYPPTGLPASIKALPEWIQLGCGDAEYNCAEKEATFIAGNMPAKLPDLSNHTSFFADTMRAQPELFEKLKSKTTKLGVNIGHCIKTGVDNKGHPMIKTVGAVAGDEESYELFAVRFVSKNCVTKLFFRSSSTPSSPLATTATPPMLSTPLT
jgi:creatine kinase